jgi:hypothetical protein
MALGAIGQTQDATPLNYYNQPMDSGNGGYIVGVPQGSQGRPDQASWMNNSGQQPSDDLLKSLGSAVYGFFNKSSADASPNPNISYNGMSQFGDSQGINGYTRQQARDQSQWQQGQQLAYNNALNKQQQLAYQQYGQTNNAIANANQQRQIVQNSANTLNNIYGNSMGQINAAAANTQNSLNSLANTAASLFR